MKPIFCSLLLVPLMAATALAQVPTADAKEGKFYIEGGVAFGVASMAGDAKSSTGLNSEPNFGVGFAAEYGITEQIGVAAKFGIGLLLHDDPGVMTIGMTFDGAFKIVEKKGDVPALSAFAGLGFVNINVDPKVGKEDDATDFVFETGVQADIGPGDPWSLQPFAGFQVVPGSRPFKAYNGFLQVFVGAKLLYKLTENFYLEPSITFFGGNFTDSVMFGIGAQVRF